MSIVTLAAAAAAGPDRSDEIRLITRSYFGTSEAPAAGSARLSFEDNGDIVVTVGDVDQTSPAVNADEWHRDNSVSGLGDDWELRATLTSGTTPIINAGLDTWLRINTSRVWANNIAVEGLITSTLTFEFRLYQTTTILKTITGSDVVARQII